MSDVALDGAGRPQGTHDDGKVTIFDFAALLRTLRRRLLWIVVPTIAFPVLAAAVSLAMSNYYWASAQVLVDPEGMQVLEGELAANGRSEQTALIYAQNQAYIMGSNRVLMEVVEREGLARDEEFGVPPPGFLASFFPASPNAVPPERIALRALQRNFNVTLNEASFVVEASVRSEDPQKAARLANAIAETYVERRADTRAEAVGRAADGLSAQLDRLRERVEDGERAVQTYKVANGIIDADGRRIGEQRLSDITTEITRVGARIAEDEALAAEVARLRADSSSFGSVAETNLTPAIVTLRARLTEAREEEETLASSLGARHPSYQVARTRSQSVSRQLEAELDRFAQSVDQRLARSRANLASLEAQLATAGAAVTAENQSSVELRQLERTAASDRLVYEAFLLRTRQLSEQEQAVNPENPQIIAAALAPLEKAGPPRTMMTGGALAFGFLFGVGLAMLREQFDQTGTTTVQRRSPSRAAPPVFRLARPTRTDDEMALLATRDQAPAFFEIAGLIGRLPAAGPVACIAITGEDADDRAFAALNTTIAAAKTGRKVLLVDASQSNNPLTAAFGLERHPGLNDFRSLRRFEPEFALTVEAAGFSFLPRGLNAIGASDAKRDLDVAGWVAAAGQDFDLVIVDMATGDAIRHDGAIAVGEASAPVGPAPLLARIVRG
jgi:uncharacterized protein involved in exopolysaccharide biosynthesis